MITKKERSFKKEITEDVYKLVLQNPFITHAQVSAAINSKYQIILSNQSITMIYKKLRLTRKKPRQYMAKSFPLRGQVQKTLEAKRAPYGPKGREGGFFLQKHF